MSDTSYVNSSLVNDVTVARVTCEKMGGFEAPGLTIDLTKLVEAQPWPIVIDLSAVQILGSQGIGVLLNVRKACEAKHRRLALTGVSEEIMMMLKISALTKLFVFKGSVPEAVAAVK